MYNSDYIRSQLSISYFLQIVETFSYSSHKSDIPLYFKINPLRQHTPLTCCIDTHLPHHLSPFTHGLLPSPCNRSQLTIILNVLIQRYVRFSHSSLHLPMPVCIRTISMRFCWMDPDSVNALFPSCLTWPLG
jgi:hypothetical protein